MARGSRRRPPHRQKLDTGATVDSTIVHRYRTARQADKKRELASVLKEQTNKAKRSRREKRRSVQRALKDEAPAMEIPRTKERCRLSDITFLESKVDPEILADEADDEFSSFFNEKSKPRLLITTSFKPSFGTKQFVKEALWLFPGSTYRPRKNYSIKGITLFCIAQGFTDLLVVGERLKQPHTLIISHLPTGPTATFRVSNFLTHAQLTEPAERTEHYPELIFKNFDTRLGRRISRLLEALFPRMRDYDGRAVATFHNQRDYIFVRVHRYVFDGLEEVRIQELGPRFTLRLLSLQLGTFDPQFGEYEWIRKKEHDANKLRWYL